MSNESYIGEHVFILGHDFIDDTYNAECSCGWESQEAHVESADAMDDWDNHCDVAFMEATS